MKITVSLTIDVDKADWLTSYPGEGETSTPAEVREDIKAHVLNVVQQCAVDVDSWEAALR